MGDESGDVLPIAPGRGRAGDDEPFLWVTIPSARLRELCRRPRWIGLPNRQLFGNAECEQMMKMMSEHLVGRGWQNRHLLLHFRTENAVVREQKNRKKIFRTVPNRKRPSILTSESVRKPSMPNIQTSGENSIQGRNAAS